MRSPTLRMHGRDLLIAAVALLATVPLGARAQMGRALRHAPRGVVFFGAQRDLVDDQRGAAMDGVTASGGHPPTAYFSEALPGTAALRLAAAVAWRGTPEPAALHGGGGPLDHLRGLRHRLWLRLGPLGADASVAGRPLFGGDARGPRTVSSTWAALGGEPLAYYDHGSRVLRVLGRVVAVPPGRTLVALVDATGAHAAAPRLVLRLVPTPAIAVPRAERAPPLGAAAVHSFVVGEHPAWTAALRADPVVRAFLEGGRVHAAARRPSRSSGCFGLPDATRRRRALRRRIASSDTPAARR